METMYERYRMAREDLDERIKYEGSAREFFDSDWQDTLNEIADGIVPVYTVGLLELACDCPAMATGEPEIGPAFDGSPTPINIIAANVYEAILSDLYEYAQELQDALVDEDAA